MTTKLRKYKQYNPHHSLQRDYKFPSDGRFLYGFLWHFQSLYHCDGVLSEVANSPFEAHILLFSLLLLFCVFFFLVVLCVCLCVCCCFFFVLCCHCNCSCCCFCFWCCCNVRSCFGHCCTFCNLFNDFVVSCLVFSLVVIVVVFPLSQSRSDFSQINRRESTWMPILLSRWYHFCVCCSCCHCGCLTLLSLWLCLFTSSLILLSSVSLLSSPVLALLPLLFFTTVILDTQSCRARRISNTKGLSMSVGCNCD